MDGVDQPFLWERKKGGGGGEGIHSADRSKDVQRGGEEVVFIVSVDKQNSDSLFHPVSEDLDFVGEGRSLHRGVEVHQVGLVGACQVFPPLLSCQHHTQTKYYKLSGCLLA